jgi:Spy/CpxP family protein refolding chaperone
MNTRHPRRIPIVAALLCLTFAPLIAQDATPPPAGGGRGQFGPGGRGPMGPPPGNVGLTLERFLGELGLTDAQKTSINALLAEQRTSLRSEMDAIRQAREALDAAILTVPTDDGLLQAQARDLSALEARLTLARAQTEAKIFQLLKPEQQQKARQLITDAEQRGPRQGRRG